MSASKSTVSIQNDVLIYRDALLMILVISLIGLVGLIYVYVTVPKSFRGDCRKSCDCDYCVSAPYNCTCVPKPPTIPPTLFPTTNIPSEPSPLITTTDVPKYDEQTETNKRRCAQQTKFYQLAPECASFSKQLEHVTNYDVLALFPFIVAIVKKVYIDSLDDWRLLGTAIAISDKWFLSSQLIIEEKFWRKFSLDNSLINIYIRSGSPFWTFGGHLNRLNLFITDRYSNIPHTLSLQNKLLLGKVESSQFKSFYSLENVPSIDSGMIEGTIVGWQMYNLIRDNGRYVMLRMWDSHLRECDRFEERCLIEPRPNSGGFCIGGVGNVLIVDKNLLGLQMYPSCYKNQTSFMLLTNQQQLKQFIISLEQF